MDKIQLQKKLSAIEKEYWNNRTAAYTEYAHANNPYKEGDVVTDHIGSIRVEKIGVHVSGGDAQCVYTGVQLKKDGQVSKVQNHTTIYQSNLIQS